MLGEKVNIHSDPFNPLAPSVAFDGQGLPVKRDTWVEKGVLKDLFYSRFWAQKQNKQPTAGPVNMIMEGGNATMDELIAGTERGVLVTRFWYIRPLDPQTLLLDRSHARRPVPDRERQGHARGEEHALEREPGRGAQQRRRHDAG